VWNSHRTTTLIQSCLSTCNLLTSIQQVYQKAVTVCTLYSVSQKNPSWGFVAIFQKRLGIFRPNFTRLLCVPIYARARIFVQLSATLMKLCYIKHDYPLQIMCAKCPPLDETHFLTFSPNTWEFLVQILHVYYTFIPTLEYKFLFTYFQLWRSYAILSATTQRAFPSMEDILSTLWWSRLIWHNFIKFTANWIKICSPAYIGTCNRLVKFGLKIPNRLGKKCQKISGGDFFGLTL